MEIMASHEALVRSFYAAFATGDRDAIDTLLSDDLRFSAPPDPHLDKAGWFERCWANRHLVAPEQEIDLVLEDGGDVVVRYLATRENGEQFRNLEYFHVDETGKIDAVQVYFGANL
ncbi:MAG: hypothetical protein QOF76_615 [Solirubrobacteraceae bacterium]|jgi:ketosteroid isomerase-like protein|nr:hypothetical protein [Solirubrobacteraceae bacterium]